MPEVQELANFLDIHVNGLFAAVALATQATMIIFWVVSPIGGMLLGSVIKQRTAFTVTLGIAALAFNGTFVGLVYLLRGQNFDASPQDTQIIIVSLAISSIAMLIAAYIVASFFAEPTPVIKDQAQLNSTGSDLSFQAKKLERLKKKGKR